MLKKLGIVKTKNKGYKVFMEHIAPDFLDNTMIPSEYVKFCWKKYETSGVSRTNGCDEELKRIFEWNDTNPTMFQSYINWYSTKDNSKNKSRMKITDSTALVVDNPQRYTLYSSDRKSIKQLINS